MNKALWKKNLHDGMLLFLAIATALAGFAWFRVKVVGRLDSGRFKQILDLLPSDWQRFSSCLLYTSPSPRDGLLSRMPSSA